jgi:hypothetical protein
VRVGDECRGLALRLPHGDVRDPGDEQEDSTIASTVVTSLRMADTNMMSGASAKTTMYSRGMLNVLGLMIAPSASTMPIVWDHVGLWPVTGC